MKIAAIVPVRKGSERVPNKNTKKFGDTTLLELKLNTLSMISELSTIIVTTDYPKAVEIACKYPNVSIHHRDEYYASSECSNQEFFKHIAETTPEEFDTLMYCPVTSPFISIATYHDAIDTYKKMQEKDSLITCNVVKQPLWLDNEPLNFKKGEILKSQDLPDVMAVNFGIAILPRDLQIDCENVYGKNPLFYPINEYESVDIDTVFDFQIAQLMFDHLLPALG